jgi:hypothetical protein
MSAQERHAYASRSENVRRSNEQIAAAAERLRFVSRVPMLCECADSGCSELIMITLADYRVARKLARFLTLPGHPRG